MRLKIELMAHKESKIVLPTGFNSYIQAFIYNNLPKDDASWLHERGFKFEKRNFKLFTFSSFLEKGLFDKRYRQFIFPQRVSFYISSPVEWILEEMAKAILVNSKLFIGNNDLIVSSVGICPSVKIETNRVDIRAITPIEVHSTLKTHDNRNRTYYYSPFEREFSEMIEKNLKKRWCSLFQNECSHSLMIQPLFKNKNYEKIIFFGNDNNRIIIKGWVGPYTLESNNVDFLKFAYDAGLGSKNSQGCGMFDIIQQ